MAEILFDRIWPTRHTGLERNMRILRIRRNNPTLRCAIHGRFSTEWQAEQYRVYEQYTQRHGWAIVARYADEGISGAAVGNRPDFNAMMADAIQHKFDVLLVMELSRLSRSAGGRLI